MPQLLLPLLLLFNLLKATHALDNGVGLTPMMGWMAWVRFRCNINCRDDPENCISERLFMQMADTMVKDGWRDLGYEYVCVDDCWQANERAQDGTIMANATRFPSGMKALGSYIHSRGLKFGVCTIQPVDSASFVHTWKVSSDRFAQLWTVPPIICITRIQKTFAVSRH